MLYKFILSVVYLIVSAHSQQVPVYKHGGVQVEELDQKIPRFISGGRKRFVTETVYGFLDFTTTVGSTKMVFTPQSEIASSLVMTASAVPVVASITSTPQQKFSSEKSKRRTNNAPTGLAKLLQEALMLKHSNPVRKKERKSDYFNIPSVTTKVISTKVFALESSIYIPEEIVVSAGQQLPSISVLGPFNTDISNALGNDLRYNFAISEPPPSVNADYALIDIKSDNPIGLVTTMGGTIVSKGQTTIHKTSVIGTMVEGQYAQILKSTSIIINPSSTQYNLISPTPRPTYETVKKVIKGTATQFFHPKMSTFLPAQSLFTRKPRYEENYPVTKRWGTNYYDKDYYADDTHIDPFYEYEDNQRAVSALRPSFKSKPSRVYSVTIAPTKTFERSQPSTFRHRYKAGSTRNTPPSFLRNSPPPQHFNRDRDRFRISSNRYKLPTTNNNNKGSRPLLKNRLVTQINEASVQVPTNIKPKQGPIITVHVSTSRPVDGLSDIWYEIVTLKSLHTYWVGAAKNTRYLTYTRTSTHTIKPTSEVQLTSSEQSIYEHPPLFENILNKQKEITTLPPINIEGQELKTLLQITTETFKTVETIYKTSVLPVQQKSRMHYYTLTQTYFISRIVLAIKTIPPFEQFIAINSLHEFNDKLLAEGTENEHSLLPGEREYDENGEIRVRPHPGYNIPDTNLAELAGGKFNPEALEKQMNPQLVNAIQSHKAFSKSTTALAGTKIEGQTLAPAVATPPLSQQALQMAYLRIMNPYMFGGLPGFPGAAQITVTSSPILITTDITTVATRVLKVRLNAKLITTTISSTEVVRTTLTSYLAVTVTAAPSLPGLGGFQFPAPPLHLG